MNTRVVAAVLPARARDAPGVYAELADLVALEHRVRGFTLLPHQPVHSLLTGRRSSRLRGRGMTFEEIRALPARRRRADDRLEGHRTHARAACPRVYRGARPPRPPGRGPAPVDVLRHPEGDEVGDRRRGGRPRPLAPLHPGRPGRGGRLRRPRGVEIAPAPEPGPGAAHPARDPGEEPRPAGRRRLASGAGSAQHGTAAGQPPGRARLRRRRGQRFRRRRRRDGVPGHGARPAQRRDRGSHLRPGPDLRARGREARGRRRRAPGRA